MKQNIDAFDYAGHICQAMRKGLLLTTKAKNMVNTMTIGWGKLGIEWNRPVFIAYVRETRYTKQLLEENGEFTVTSQEKTLFRTNIEQLEAYELMSLEGAVCKGPDKENNGEYRTVTGFYKYYRK